MRRALPFLAVFALAGCGGGGSTSTEASQPPASAKEVTVTETEFSIAPATINVPSTGEYVFKAVNKGQVTHALEIEGHGVEADTEDIDPGESGRVTVNLTKAGSYEVYCPIDGHKDKGMKATLVVGNVTGSPTVQETTKEMTTTVATTTTTEATTTGSGY